MKLETILKIAGITLLVLFVTLRIYGMATERGCGWNPVSHLKAAYNELHCYCKQDTFVYGGFSCLNCEQLCAEVEYDLKMMNCTLC